MHHRSRSKYLLSSLLSLFLVTGVRSRAQDTTPAPDASQPPATTTPATTTPDATAQPRQQQPQTPEQRAKVLRDAQERVRSRRQRRIAALIADTYSHKYEAYFGGGYLRFRPGETITNFAPTPDCPAIGVVQHDTEAGWNVGLTDYIRPRLGITGDFRGYYGTTYTGNNCYSVHNPSISQYTFMGGPQYSITQRPKWAASAQLLAGAGHGNFDTGTGGLPGTLLGLYPNATVFNASAGASFDYNLGPGLALRLTPNVLFTNYGSKAQFNRGFNAGVVYRFGRKK